MTAGLGRVRFLDGLRGWGAVFVLLFHTFVQVLPPVTGMERVGLLVPFNGQIAVLLFFVVSGFSLAVNYFATGDLAGWITLAVGRYFRLAIPIFCACLLVWLAMIWFPLDPAGSRSEVLRDGLNFQPTVAHLMRFSLIDVFLNYHNDQSFIGPLWTMRIELAGSVLVLVAILALRPAVRWRFFLSALATAALAFAPFTGGMMLGLFLAGVTMAEAFRRSWLDRVPVTVGVLFLILGGAVPLLLPYYTLTWGFVGAVPLVLGSICVPATREILENRLSAILGRISFPLYLVHAPVIVWIGEPLMRHQAGFTRLLIDLLVVLFSFGAAFAFLPINQFAIRLAHRLGRFAVSVLPARWMARQKPVNQAGDPQ